MTTKSKAEPTRRKSKSVSRSKAIHLTPGMIEAHEREQAMKEFQHFMDNCTRAEMRVVGHLRVYDFGSVAEIMKEIRRLLGESAGKCKVIPLPMPKKLDRDILEYLKRLNNQQRPELTVIPKSDPDLETEGCLDHPIH